MSITTELSNLVDDLTSLEVGVIRTEEAQADDLANPNNELLTYSRVELEGDSVHFVAQSLIKDEQSDELLALHKKIVQTSQEGRLALMGFVASTLKSIV